MSVKRTPFRALALAIATLTLAGSVLAKDAKKKPKDDAEPDKKGGMMEEGGKDPAETESLEHDEGAFVPGKEKLKKKNRPADSGEIGATEGDEATADGEPPPEKPKEKKPAVLRKTIGVFVEGMYAFGRAPLPGSFNQDTGDTTTGHASAFTIMAGGHYDFTPTFRLMVRVPWVIGTVKNGAQDASINALAIPELAGRLRLSPAGDTEWAVRLAVGIPVAQGNPDFNNRIDTGGRAQGVLLRVADAGNGWHDPELYAPKRLPITPALLLNHRLEKWRFGGEFKAVFMPKIGGDIQTPNLATGGTLSTPGLAWSLLLGGSVSYEAITHGFVALAAWARYGFSEIVNYDGPATTPSPFQLAIEPKLLAQFGHVVPSVGFVIPIGGQLGGDIFGLRAHIDVIF